MKKILLAAALVITMVFCANAQKDSFFTDWEEYGYSMNRDYDVPTLPGSHGLVDNQVVPVGSGLLILTALGAGYALKKKREE
jgi:hypothetical protein